MGGFAGIGGSSATTDRNTQLSAQSGLWNVFNWALPQGEKQQTTGASTLAGSLNTLGPAQQYYQNLLSPGRAQATLNAAPAVNATLDQADAAKRQSGNFGTARTGGTAAANQNAGAQTQKSIDDIINANLFGGQQSGAQGLVGVSGAQAGVGEGQLANAASLLGLGQSSVGSIMNNATESRPISQKINQETAAEWGGLANAFLSFLGV